MAILFQGTKICASECLRSYADFEGVFVKGRDSKAGAVYADAVAEITVAEDFGCFRDGKGCAAIFRLGFEFRDHLKMSAKSFGVLRSHTSYYFYYSGEHDILNFGC